MKWAVSKSKNNSAIGSLKNEMDLFFNNFFDLNPSKLFENSWNPAIDLEETDDSIIVRAEVPGVNENEINLSLENNFLSISGEKNEESNRKENNCFISERKFGSFKRTVSLPENINRDDVKATYKDGVLEITFSKTDKAKTKKIDIKVK